MESSELQYLPLTLLKQNPIDMQDTNWVLKYHVGKVSYKEVRKQDNRKIPEDSLLKIKDDAQPKILFWITMLDESYEKLLLSLSGIYRSIYEL